MAIIGAVAFSEFFVLTLYLQDVLGYSAIQSGVAFTGFALAVVVASNIRPGRRRPGSGCRFTLTAGLVAFAVSVAYLTGLPAHGHYFWNLFPGFVLGGAGMGLSFVPVTIAGSMTGRRARRRRRRLGADQHEPPDRRGGRPRRDQRDRDGFVRQLRACASGLRGDERRRARPRVPDGSLRPHRAPGRRRARLGRPDQAAADRSVGGRGRPRGRPARGRLDPTGRAGGRAVVARGSRGRA